MLIFDTTQYELCPQFNDEVANTPNPGKPQEEEYNSADETEEVRRQRNEWTPLIQFEHESQTPKINVYENDDNTVSPQDNQAHSIVSDD